MCNYIIFTKPEASIHTHNTKQYESTELPSAQWYLSVYEIQSSIAGCNGTDRPLQVSALTRMYNYETGTASETETESTTHSTWISLSNLGPLTWC